MTCVNSRDTITQDAGEALGNHFDYLDNDHVVTSFCRTADGTWITWISPVSGDDFGDALEDGPDPIQVGDQNKADWPSNIASANPINVGFFPDDGSGPIVYELGVDPIFTWKTLPASRGETLCGYWFVVGDVFELWGKAILCGWHMNVVDVQVRTDGANVWVVVLAQESVKYPFLSTTRHSDRCGVEHESMEELWPERGADAFAHDFDSGGYFWLYDAGLAGGDRFLGPYDDPGHSNSLRWQPCRITVFAGDIGGFTKIDTVEAKFDNYEASSSLVSGVEAAASPAEPDVLHVLWAEGGNFGEKDVDPQRGQRLNYSQWSSTAKTLDTDLLYETTTGYGSTALDEGQPGGAFMPPDQFVFTCEIILRNDHGAPIAITWPWLADDDGPLSPDSQAQFWDLNLGEVIQTLDPSLIPTAGEAGDIAYLNGTLAQAPTRPPRRLQFASSLYTDPLLDGRDVYLVCAHYTNGIGVPPSNIAVFYRIPCDGSDTFDFMDGIRRVNYSINATLGTFITADFLSDHDNIWMPAPGSSVAHFTRRCIPTWELLAGFPADGNEYDWSVFKIGTSPPAIVTDTAGDWLAGAGNAPLAAHRSGEGIDIAALRAKICRCCIPCSRQGLHVWQIV